MDAVAGDGGQILRQFNIHRDVFIQQIVVGQVQHALHDFVDTERIPMLRFAFFQKQAQAMNHFAGALVFGHDVLKNLAELGKIDIVAGEESLSGLRIAENGCERLV